MKTSLVIPIVLFAIFTISEISCEETCMKFNDKCSVDSDCCSNNCFMADNVDKRICLDPKNATFVENGWCSYNKSFHNDSSDDTFKFLGINAAHAVLPVGTEVILKNTFNNKTTDVTINTYLQTNNETLLELSKEVAKELDVKDGDRIPCSIYLYEPKLKDSLIKKLIGFCAGFFLVVFIVISLL